VEDLAYQALLDEMGEISAAIPPQDLAVQFDIASDYIKSEAQRNPSYLSTFARRLPPTEGRGRYGAVREPVRRFDRKSGRRSRGWTASLLGQHQQQASAGGARYDGYGRVSEPDRLQSQPAIAVASLWLSA
jgi:hypothetical protein